MEPIGAPSNLLPPPNDAYVSPAQFHLLAGQGIVIRDIRHSLFTRSLPPPPPGGVRLHEFGSQVDMQVSTDGGQTFGHARVPAQVVVRVEDVGGGMFDTEMLQLDLRGGDWPAGLRVRESPTRASRGGVQIDAAPGGTFRIGSFFDIFVEVSLDDGQNWQPVSNPARVELVSAAAEQAVSSPDLPPIPGQYVSPREFHQRYANGIIIRNIRHWRFTQNQAPPPPGQEQVHRFNSVLDMEVSRGDGAPFDRVSVPASVEVRVRSTQEAGNTRYFETEMLALNLVGSTMRVRESPTRASSGRTSVRQVPEGGFRISSFFDIFTEISLDGGNTWVAALAPGRVVLEVPPVSPLEIACPPDTTVLALNPEGAVVNYSSAVATGGCAPVTVTCNPASGSMFPIGTTTVTCVATDACGTTARCAFKVTVTPPPPVEIDHWGRTSALVGIQGPGGLMNVVLTGPTTVEVALDSLHDGDGDGREAVKTELVRMELSGGGVTLRAGRQAGLGQASPGEIEERANLRSGRLDLPGPERPFCLAGECEGALAESFFDVFFEVEVGGQVLHNGQALRMEAVIDRKPPGTVYRHVITRPIPLLTREGKESGFFLVSANHDTRPVEIDHFENSTAIVDLMLPTGEVQTVRLNGPATVKVLIGDNGEAADTDGDGLDDVSAEMVALQLTGSSPLGPVVMRLPDPARHPEQRTAGQIEEIGNTQSGRLDVPPFAAAGSAWSFFDVFFELEVAGRVYHNHTPKRMRTVIDHKPPGRGTVYFDPVVIELFDKEDQPTGIKVLRAAHVPVGPPPEIDHFPASAADLDVQLPNGSIHSVHLEGPTTIMVWVGPNGESGDLDGDGRDDVAAEMRQLDLRGTHPALGPIVMRLRSPTAHPFRRSLGGIEETANTQSGRLDVRPFALAGEADSFFDVFFEVEAGGNVYHSDKPKRMLARINHKPPGPGTVYEFPEVLELLDQRNQPTGIKILKARHVPVPRECPLIIACPDDILVRTEDPSGAVVTFAAVAEGGCPPITVDCKPPSGTKFPVGTTVVTCTATDARGNTATCSFRVLVRPVEVDRFPFSLARLEVALPDGSIEPLTLAGPTTVHVDIGFKGEADDSDGDGLDDVDSVMTQLELSGTSARFGLVKLRLRPASKHP
ncbi:MAG: HYR domain-containing protein, partial [Verrucomicrobiales bacterium]|nr:HYR domain-containing protein [Verrucomicrobiales bacterium]